MDNIGAIPSSTLPKNKPIEESVTENQNVNRDLALNNESDDDSVGVAKSDLNMPELVSRVNQFVHSFSTKLSFHYNDRIDKPVIRVVDKDTGKVLRQIPPEEMVKQLRHLYDSTGIILQSKI
jgi:flagellar protein FlaG